MLDRTSPTPLWAQIESDLRAKLLRGDFDEAFPTEPDLMSTYQVSRSTVRQAVASLERSGLIQRRRGIGTRVTERPLVDSMARIYSLAGWITSTGLTERSVVPISEVTVLPGEASEQLGLKPSSECVHIMRVRYAGDEPIAIDRSWLPRHLGEILLGEDLTSGSLYDLLGNQGVVATASTEQIRPVDPDRDDRAILDLPAEQMAFRIQRTVHANTTPVEYRISIIRGDRYTLTASWGTPSPELAGGIDDFASTDRLLDADST